MRQDVIKTVALVESATFSGLARAVVEFGQSAARPAPGVPRVDMTVVTYHRGAEEQAIAVARPRAGFEPERTQIRLVRQGLTGRPYWAVSFSVPAASGDGYAKLTTVRVDANTGTIEAVNRER